MSEATPSCQIVVDGDSLAPPMLQLCVPDSESGAVTVRLSFPASDEAPRALATLLWASKSRDSIPIQVRQQGQLQAAGDFQVEMRGLAMSDTGERLISFTFLLRPGTEPVGQAPTGPSTMVVESAKKWLGLDA